MIPATLWLVGCGNMGGAMLRRWVEVALPPAAVTVIDPGRPQVPAGVRLLPSRPTDEPAPDALVLAVKPQGLDEAATTWGDLEVPLLLSILAGVDEETLRRRFAARAVVRAMPNLPVSLGRGVVALHARGADDGARAAATALAEPLGLAEWIAQEGQFEAVTALSGCGPGFLFRFVDALAAAGAALGLPAEQAARLAMATVEGSALLAAGADVSPATLADRVASPGGSTREGLNVLDHDDALKTLLAETLRAAAARSAEMAAAARG